MDRRLTRFQADDGIVVEGPENDHARVSGWGRTLERRELRWGTLVREPAPRYGHQAVLTNLTARLAFHARHEGLGRVCVSPVDVVLDDARALVLQPDLIFVSTDRLSILRDRVWGAPDLVIEVLSPGSARRDRVEKLRWYRQFGVREYWLVDTHAATIDVLALTRKRSRRRTFTGPRPVRSHVFPHLMLLAAEVFDL